MNSSPEAAPQTATLRGPSPQQDLSLFDQMQRAETLLRQQGATHPGVQNGGGGSLPPLQSPFANPAQDQQNLLAYQQSLNLPPPPVFDPRDQNMNPAFLISPEQDALNRADHEAYWARAQNDPRIDAIEESIGPVEAISGATALAKGGVALTRYAVSPAGRNTLDNAMSNAFDFVASNPKISRAVGDARQFGRGVDEFLEAYPLAKMGKDPRRALNEARFRYDSFRNRKSLGANPFVGKDRDQIIQRLTDAGYEFRTRPGPLRYDEHGFPIGNYVNPANRRSVNLDLMHDEPKGSHLGFHRPGTTRRLFRTPAKVRNLSTGWAPDVPLNYPPRGR